MKSLLVISEEKGLAETLASELAEYSIVGVNRSDAESAIHKKIFDLIIIDNDTNYITDKAIKNVIRLARPIRLYEAIYTIERQLKSKSIFTEEIEFSPGFLFSSVDRLVRLSDNSIRIALTEKESELLEYLTNEDNVTSRDILLKNIWRYNDDINTHTIETHIYRLRNKLKQLNDCLDIVFSEESGYRIKAMAPK